MRYTDSIARSADHLRAALALMTKQRAALHPTSYAVWYEFVSGRNPGLNEALQISTAGGNTLDEEQTWGLYQAHVCEQDTALGGKIAEGLTEVLDSMSASATQAGQESARFDSSLSNWVEQLLSNPPAQTQADVLQELLSGTREIRGALSELQHRLDSSQTEIQSLRDEVQRARGEALLDALTGLANRRAFDQQLQICTSTPLLDASLAPCLVLGDIDYFKQVNDSYGHAFGDRVLQAVAQTLKRVAAQGHGGARVGEADEKNGACASSYAPPIAARVGGEEFAMLLPRSHLRQAQTMAESLRASIAAGRIKRDGCEQDTKRVTISLGVTQMLAGDCAETFFKRADQALYDSKNKGRNQVTVLSAA
jgi:diguanylate cyclase